MKDKLYSIKEAADILGMTRSGVHWLKDTGKIKAEKIGEQWVISEEELERYRSNHPKNNATTEEGE